MAVPAATRSPAARLSAAQLDAVRQRFDGALDDLVARLREDPYVLAVILAGSLSHDVVWEKSDIDLFVVTQEPRGGRASARSLCLLERDVTIHVYPTPRSRFREMMQGQLQGSFMHSMMALGRIVFARDDSIRELIEESRRLGAQDRALQLLRAGTWVLPGLAKAQKWLFVKEDPAYCCLWVFKLVDALATVEVVRHSLVPTREVVQQALELDPQLFRALYTELLDGPKDAAAMERVLELIEGYLHRHVRELFGPIFQVLAAAGGPRSTTELNHHFATQTNLEMLETAYEWLADHEYITRLSTPVRLTDRSRVSLHEAAYYYDDAS